MKRNGKTMKRIGKKSLGAVLMALAATGICAVAQAGERIVPEAEKCQLWIALEGRGTIGAEAWRAGEVWLLPELGEQPEIRAETDSRLLRTHVPR